MKILKNQFSLLFFLFLIMILDSQLSFAINNILHFTSIVSTHLMLLGLMYFFKNQSPLFVLITAGILGCLFDSFYLGSLGIATILLPLIFISVIYLPRSVITSWSQGFLVFMLIVFLYEVGGYLLSQFWGIYAGNMVSFISTRFTPTFLANIIIYVLGQKGLKFLFG